MKKLLCVLFALIMMFSFVACNSESAKDSDDKDDAEETSQTTAADKDDVSENDTTAPTSDDVPDTAPSATEPSVPAIVPTPPSTELVFSFEETVIVDNDQCSIKLTDIYEDDIWGYTIKAEIENKSPDKTYMFSLEHSAINGVEVSNLFAKEVAAGKKANGEITLTDDALKENGINHYTDIALSFRVYDTNDWSADEVLEETFHIYPYGEANASRFTRAPKATDTVIVDNDDITIIVTGYGVDEIWGYEANLYLVNKTDKELMFDIEDCSINGYMLDPFFATSIYPNEAKFTEINWSTEDLEENSITEVEEIELTFEVTDYSDWSADDIFNETVTLKP